MTNGPTAVAQGIEAGRAGAVNPSPFALGDQIRLANLIYGEAASEDVDTMRMVGSSVLNRMDSGRVTEFGDTIENVIFSPRSPFFAAQDNSPRFKEAQQQKFPDAPSERAYKQALQVAGGLIRGTIERTEGMFFFEPKEVSAMKRRKKKVFDFKKVRDTGRVGKFKTFSY